MHAIAHFDVTGWNPASSNQPDARPKRSRVVTRKVFGDGSLEDERSGD